MKTYKVTVEPDPADGATTHLVLHVDTRPPRPRVVEMILRSPVHGGLLAAAMPDIDLAGVVEALSTLIQRSESLPSSNDPETGEMSSTGPSGAAQTSPPTGAAPAPTPTVAALPNGQQRDPGGRAYRRMPDAEQLQAVYEHAGTVTGVAKHYGVPRHTAQGWMARLRKLGTEGNEAVEGAATQRGRAEHRGSEK
jgi:hypothetical protein